MQGTQTLPVLCPLNEKTRAAPELLINVSAAIQSQPLGAVLITAAAVGFVVASCREFATSANRQVASLQNPLESWWADLEKGEVGRLARLARSRRRPEGGNPVSQGQDEAAHDQFRQVKALLLKLNSADEHLWKSAFEELEYFDPRLAIELPELMERVTDSPARQRMVEVSERAGRPALSKGDWIEIRRRRLQFLLAAVTVPGGPSRRFLE